MEWEWLDVTDGVAVKCTSCGQVFEAKEEDHPTSKLIDLVGIVIAIIDKHVCEVIDA